MRDAHYLRAQARLCLQIAQHISDARAAASLRLDAARYFAQAVQAEARSGGTTLVTFNKKDSHPMAQYYFIVDYDGSTIRDDDGEIFRSLQEAEAHSAVVARELAHNNGKTVVVRVTDDEGMVLAKISPSAD